MVTYKNKFLTGWRKFIFFQYFKIYIFLRYTFLLFFRKISFKQYFIFFKRLLLFFEKVKINKVVKTRGVYKLHIYFPAFPTKAFFIALNKFLTLKKKDFYPYPTSVLLSMTKACNYNCKHCYQKRDKMKDISLEKLKQIAKQIQDLNISFINIEGGEPMLKFNRLIGLMENIDNRSEVWVNTTGFSVTEEKARKMKEVGVFGVMVSLHHWDKNKHDKFVGVNGAFDRAISALRIFKKSGLSTAINCTGTQELINTGGFNKIIKIAKNNGCAIVQLIHEKPAGAWLDKDDTLNNIYLKRLYNSHIIYNKSRKYKKYPAVSSQVFESAKNNFGCTAGGIERFYINANGEVQPCEFVNVSFGNINDEPFLEIYKRMRDVFNKPRTGWLCCTEHNKIKKELKRLKMKSTPLPKEKSNKIIKEFNFGEETKLYKKMRLYK